jgi:hypothetical protein
MKKGFCVEPWHARSISLSIKNEGHDLDAGFCKVERA